MAESNPLLFYLSNDETSLKKFYQTKTIEILLTDGDETQQNDDEIVYVNIPKDLTDDPTELCALLENTYSLKKEVWLSIAVSYALRNKFKQATELVNSALQSKQLEKAGTFEKFPFHLFTAALNMRKSRVCSTNEERNQCLNVADSELNIALRFNPTSVGALLAKAVLFSLRNPRSYDELLSLFEKVLSQDSNNAFALFGKAKILYKKRNYSLALKIFQQILILNPILKPDPRIGIGMCFWNLGDKSSALSAWERSFELYPKDLTSNLLVAITKIDSTFNKSLTDGEFVEKYTEVFQIIADFYNGKILPEYEGEVEESDDQHQPSEISYKKSPYLLSILSSYLFSKGSYSILSNVLEAFLKQDTILLSSYNPSIISDIYFWIARMIFSLATEDGVEIPEEYKDSTSSGLIAKCQQYITKSLSYDKNNLFTKFLSGQLQFYKKNINESILIFETLIKNFEGEASNLGKGQKADSKDKLIEINYVLGLLYHERVFSEDAQSNIDVKGFVNKEATDFVVKSNDHLLKYFKLCLQLKESVIVNAHLTAAKNFEYLNQFDQVLLNLEKAAALYQTQSGTLDSEGTLVEDVGKQIPTELLNNIGVFQFLKSNFVAAKTFFNLAEVANKSSASAIKDEEELALKYNIARVTEIDDARTAATIYKEVLDKTPNYIFAIVRSLYLKALDPVIIADDVKLNDLDREIRELVRMYKSNLTVRSFYGWFMSNYKIRLISYKEELGKGNPEELLHKETLTSYDSHEMYALVSLANLYLLSARDFKIPGKGKADVASKRNNFYIRATQLYQKALSVDPNNLFAAQGLAIIFSELKRSDLALEIFKKIRDSLNDVSIYINLGHVLIEVREYSKAIECYEIVTNRFEKKAGSALSAEEQSQDFDVFDESVVEKYKSDPLIVSSNCTYFSLLGRAWYCRGVGEKSLESLRNSLKFSKKAYLIAVSQTKSGDLLISSLKFNIAFIYFQIAEFVRKLPNNKRTSQEIESTMEGLSLAIKILEDLANTEYPPYPAEELKQRAVMGSNTIQSSLQKELEIQKKYEQESSEKLIEGMKIREQEKAKIEEEQRRFRENEEKVKEKLKLEREELQKKAIEWAAELADLNKMHSAKEKKKKGKKTDEDGFVLEEGSSSEEENGENEGNTEKPEKPEKPSKKSRKGRKRKASSSEPKAKQTKRKLVKKYKSEEMIVDSDDDGDGMINEDESEQEKDDLEKAEEELENSAIEEDEDDENPEDELETLKAEAEKERSTEEQEKDLAMAKGEEEDVDEGDDLF